MTSVLSVFASGADQQIVVAIAVGIDAVRPRKCSELVAINSSRQTQHVDAAVVIEIRRCLIQDNLASQARHIPNDVDLPTVHAIDDAKSAPAVFLVHERERLTKGQVHALVVVEVAGRERGSDVQETAENERARRQSVPIEPSQRDVRVVRRQRSGWEVAAWHTVRSAEVDQDAGLAKRIRLVATDQSEVVKPVTIDIAQPNTGAAMSKATTFRPSPRTNTADESSVAVPFSTFVAVKT